MADVDIDPFGEHESRTEEPTDEHIPLDQVTPVGSGGVPLRGGGISTFFFVSQTFYSEYAILHLILF